MNVNDETKLEAYVELIAGLECENKIQSRLSDTAATTRRSIK